MSGGRGGTGSEDGLLLADNFAPMSARFTTWRQFNSAFSFIDTVPDIRSTWCCIAALHWYMVYAYHYYGYWKLEAVKKVSNVWHGKVGDSH